MRVDPRLSVVAKRLADVERIIAVTGGKGGIGKSFTATVLALTLARLGYRVGLLDLDLSAPSAHVILGLEEGVFPEEDKGIIAPQVQGVAFMSITYFSGDAPTPLRGIDSSNAMLELLAITRWGPLDFLIVDMPPGIGDAAMDVVRWLNRAEFLVVTTASKVALETVKKVIRMLAELQMPVIGVVENMNVKDAATVLDALKEYNVPFLGTIKFDTDLEDAIGDVDALLETDAAKQLARIVPGKLRFAKAH